MRIRPLPWLCAVLAGCLWPGSALAASRDADTVFSRIADDYLGGYLAFRPATGVALGLHQYDGKAGDFSGAAIGAELARLRSFDRQLAELDNTGLSPQNSRDFRLVRGSIHREIFGVEELGEFSRNPITYVGALDVTPYLKRDFAPLPNRVRSLVAVLNQAPAILAAARTNLAGSLPRPLVQAAIDRAGAAADFLDWDLVAAVKGVEDAPLLAAFTTADRTAIRELHAYADWLTTEKLRAAGDQYALGRESYVRLLDCEMINVRPERLLALGLGEVTAKQKAFADAAQAIDGARKPLEVFQAIRTEHPAATNLVADMTRSLDALRQFVVEHHLVTVPADARVLVTATPPWLRASTFALMNAPGPFETKAMQASYYLTPVDTNWPAAQQQAWLEAFNFYTANIEAIHEAYPGHYLQSRHLKASAATYAEKIFGSYSFTEGWAHYCEQMVIDEGFGGGAAPGDAVRAAKFRLAQTHEALLRACRMCVSIRMHCEGLTVDEAAKFFEDQGYCDDGTAHDEAVRAIYDPEYLYYTLGKLEMLKLRDDYHQQEGANFSPQKFHDELLRHGMPPIRLLREVMLKDRATWDAVL
jgi:uncharacterized protein (DUF885 family)